MAGAYPGIGSYLLSAHFLAKEKIRSNSDRKKSSFVLNCQFFQNLGGLFYSVQNFSQKNGQFFKISKYISDRI